ncbi:hypothetical protein L914_05793 [Phytophthora nicotianae]|uniref:Uncharacterized protein n=1 Tax=Phytophthora nicotianae TaxID=4792 RepID=W2NR15_PHYNI|nr:hypothetical protein L914_05793 [Phytophthora nicotianae]
MMQSGTFSKKRIVLVVELQANLLMGIDETDFMTCRQGNNADYSIAMCALQGRHKIHSQQYFFHKRLARLGESHAGSAISSAQSCEIAQDQGNRRYGTGVRRRDHERQQLGQDQGHPDVSESGATRAHPRRPRWAKPTALDKPAQSSEAPSNGELSNQTMRTDASPVSRMSGRRRLGSRGAGISGRERGKRKPQ